MRVLLRAIAICALGGAVGCNVTPQEVSALPDGGTTGGGSTASGGTGSRTNGGIGGINAGNNGGGSTSGGRGSTSSGGVNGGGTSGGTTGAPDSGPPPVPNGIEFVGTTNPFLGVDYQATYSINPINTFNFRVVTTTDGGVSNIPVIFAPGAANANGSSLLDATSTPAATVSGSTDSAGNIGVQLQAGTQAGQVSVVATVTLPDSATASATGTSSVVGTQPSVSNSGMACTPVNLPVFSGPNSVCAVKSTYPGTTSCTVNLGDRFGNAIGISVPVHFYSEAGLWQSQTVSTPAYGAANPGKAVNTLETQGATLPQPYPPQPDEPFYTGTCLGLPYTYNPRNGLVTVMAAFTGEEPFQDEFGVGYWEAGDPFVDMGQPFVDNDDSSVWQPGDVCAGTSSAGVCNGPNHVWDGNANVWVENWILYTGDPTTAVATPDPGPTVHALALTGEVTWGDVNLNIPAAQAVCDVSAPGSGEPQGFTCTYPFPPTAASPPDSYGMGDTPAQIKLCDAGYIILPDAGQQPNQICSYLTVITGFGSGFTGTYELSESTFQDGGGSPYCINASCKIFADTPDTSQICGIAIGP